MRDLIIYEDHVVIAPHYKAKSPSIAGVSLKDLARIAYLGTKYWSYLLTRHQIYLYSYSNYDGYPLEDFVQFFYEAQSVSLHRKEASLAVVFEATSGDYDYVAMASRDTSTGYKRGKRSPPQETRFKADRASVAIPPGETESWIPREIVRLAAIVDNLEASTQSLRSWADSSVDMRVGCSTVGCKNQAGVIFPPARLKPYADKGLSLETFRGKLKCSHCGKPSSRLGVA
ncbi:MULTISPECIES: hypothetical protein [Rhizobium]|uniref:hypothetical protein n=1 Tax=Rhizobium TaxID=379 RepID=UPI00102FD6E2|nr:hypothetical protein [Rhizobium ruizarguesonis]TBB50221.1 hypothetical protein ELH46_16250 [Rhizobium ruizarguesonis]